MHHAPRSSCKTNHSTQSVNPSNCRVEGKITLLSTLHTLTAVLRTVHTCTPHHLRHPAMHAQPANEQGFPLPSLGSCAAQQSATRLEQWTPHLKTVVCACSVGTTLSPLTHSYQQTQLTLSLSSVVFIVYTGEKRRRKVVQHYPFLLVLFQQVASWRRPIVVVGEEVHYSSKFGLSQTMVGRWCPLKAQVSLSDSSVSVAPLRYTCPSSSWHL